MRSTQLPCATFPPRAEQQRNGVVDSSAVMADRSGRGSYKLRGADRLERDEGIRSAEFIKASGHAALREQAKHVDEPERPHRPEDTLAPWGPCTHGSRSESNGLDKCRPLP